MTSNASARAAGAAYLVTIVAGLFAEAFVRSTLFVPRDAQASAAIIRANELLFRSAGLADLVMLLAYLLVTVVLLNLFEPVNMSISRLAAFLSLTGVAVLATNTLIHFAPLGLLTGPAVNDGVTSAQAAGMSYAYLRLHDVGYSISSAFFGLYCLLVGWLSYRSNFIPRLVGVLMALGGVFYLVDGTLKLLAVAVPGGPLFLLPGLIGELALSLWLLTFGVRAPSLGVSSMPAARNG